jgi:hypothetical protein
VLSPTARYAQAESRKPYFMFPAEQIFSNLQLRRSDLGANCQGGAPRCAHSVIQMKWPQCLGRSQEKHFRFSLHMGLSRRHLSEMRLDRSPNTRIASQDKHFHFSLNIDSSIRMVVSLMKYSKPVLVTSRQHCPKWN